jgi:hypothetical protein
VLKNKSLVDDKIKNKRIRIIKNIIIEGSKEDFNKQ